MGPSRFFFSADPPLPSRLGIEVSADLGRDLEAALADTERLAGTILAHNHRPLGEASVPRLALPASFAEVLAVTCAEARAAGLQDHAHSLVEHYTRALPLALVLQQRAAEPPATWLFHEPPPWEALSRLRVGLERLRTALVDAEVPTECVPAGLLDGPDPGWPSTLGALYAATYFGSSFPMFAAHANDLAALGREVAAAGADPAARWATVDYRLGAAVLHEILHFGRDREVLFPPYLDEAITGYLGVHFLRETAYPAPDCDNALDGFPWFAQVGLALVRAFGRGPILAAQVGARPWRAVLGNDLQAALDRLGWDAYLERRPLHFHPDSTRPDLWAKLFYLAAAGRPLAELTLAELDRISMHACALPDDDAETDALEAEMLEHALAAMCLEKVREEPVWRIRAAPPAGPVSLDFAAGCCRTAARPGSGDPAPLYVLPPTFCAARLADGVAACTLELRSADPAVLAEVAEALRSGRLDAGASLWSARPHTS